MISKIKTEFGKLGKTSIFALASLVRQLLTNIPCLRYTREHGDSSHGF